jgi:hypothetical protein
VVGKTWDLFDDGALFDSLWFFITTLKILVLVLVSAASLWLSLKHLKLCVPSCQHND